MIILRICTMFASAGWTLTVRFNLVPMGRGMSTTDDVASDSMRSRGYRASWSLVDQCLSSGTNFLLLILVIRSTSTSEVGTFSLAYTSFFMALAVIRGFALEPLIVRYASASNDAWKEASSAAVGTALSLAVAIGGVVLAGALLGGGVVGTAFAAVAVMLPGLIVQDSWRQAFFCAGRPQSACLNDLAFLLLQISGYVLLARYAEFTVANLILVWGAAASAAAIIGSIQTRSLPAPAKTWSWYRENRALGPAFAADYIVNRGAEQIAMVAIAGVAGLSALGSVATARAFFAPMTTVQSGLNSFAMPESARMYVSGRVRELRKFSLVYGLLMGSLMLGAGCALFLLPQQLGVALFHDNWAPARQVLIAMTAFSVLNAVALGLWTGLRGMQLAKSTLYGRTAAGVVTLLATVLGAAYGGADGATWGLTFGAACLSLVMAFLLFRGRGGTKSAGSQAAVEQQALRSELAWQ